MFLLLGKRIGKHSGKKGSDQNIEAVGELQGLQEGYFIERDQVCCGDQQNHADNGNGSHEAVSRFFFYGEIKQRRKNHRQAGEIMMGFEIIIPEKQIIAQGREKGVGIIPHDLLSPESPVSRVLEFLGAHLLKQRNQEESTEHKADSHRFEQRQPMPVFRDPLCVNHQKNRKYRRSQSKGDEVGKGEKGKPDRQFQGVLLSFFQIPVHCKDDRGKKGECHRFSERRPDEEIVDVIGREDKHDRAEDTDVILLRKITHERQAKTGAEKGNEEYVDLVYQKDRHVQRIEKGSGKKKEITVEERTCIAEPEILVGIHRQRELMIGDRSQNSLNPGQMKGKIQTGKYGTLIKRDTEKKGDEKCGKKIVRSFSEHNAYIISVNGSCAEIS